MPEIMFIDDNGKKVESYLISTSVYKVLLLLMQGSGIVHASDNPYAND